VQLRRVLGQAAVAHLDVAELALDHPEGVLAAGADLGLQVLDLLLDPAEPRLVSTPD
jgi:hypothetical protein